MISLRLSFLESLLRKSQRARLRSLIRGYIKLKKSDELARIAELKRLLSDQKLKINIDHFSPFIIGKMIDSSLKEVCIRQYLLLRLGAHNLNEALLLCISKKNKKIIYPMPKDWRKLLDKNGFRVAHKRSTILWQIYLILLIGYGCLTFIRIILKCISDASKKSRSLEPYIYFSNLGQKNIPKDKGGTQSYDVISWYIKYSSGNVNFRSIKHDVADTNPITLDNVNIESAKCGPIPNLSGWKNIINFSLWGFFAIILSIVDLVRGRWWHALILNQAMLAKKASLTKPENLAKEYFFHNSNQTYRPLWTYTAEKYGSEIVLYFYSTNVEGLKSDPTYAWRCMTWPTYLVWDQYQLNFIRRSIGDSATVKVVGPVWFHDDLIQLTPIASGRNIAVFDVVPHRVSRYCVLAEEFDLCVPTITNVFLKDIFDVATQTNSRFIYKAKRNIGRLAHPHYRYLLNSIVPNPSVLIVDPGTSANEVINSSSLVISFPFTATAIIAREQGKPSCYYDPNNILKQDHQAAHGIPIIENKRMLLNWVNSQFRC